MSHIIAGDPAPTNPTGRLRTEVLAAIADLQEATAAADVIRRRRSIATGRRIVAAELRRMAAEAGESRG